MPVRGGALVLVRQAKLGASCRVQVPVEEGLTHHSYRVLRLGRRWKPNDTGEAYPGHHVDRRGARTPQSVRQPRKGNQADGEGCNASAAHTEGSHW